jgi:UDP-glucose 4-epimerase
VLRTARRYRKKVLIASTSEVYGKGVSFPFSEDDDSLLGPTSRNRWAYASSKAVDEFLGLAYYREVGLPVVIFRLFNTVGPRQRGQYGMVVPRFVRWAIDGEPIQVYGTGDQTRCFGNVFDVVKAIHLLAEEPSAIGRVFNIGTTEEISIMQLAERVRQRAGSQSDIKLVPYEEAYEPGFEDFARRVPSLERIMQTIEWAPSTTLDDTIDQIIRYFEENETHG